MSQSNITRSQRRAQFHYDRLICGISNAITISDWIILEMDNAKMYMFLPPSFKCTCFSHPPSNVHFFPPSFKCTFFPTLLQMYMFFPPSFKCTCFYRPPSNVHFFPPSFKCTCVYRPLQMYMFFPLSFKCARFPTLLLAAQRF